MRVFVTGASGHIGFAVVAELLGAGHEVAGLARSEASAEKLRKAGAEVVRGDLDDLAGLVAAARAAEGVIHLGYKHDLAFGGTPDGFVKAAEHDTRVVKAFGEALIGSNKPFVNTSGTAQLALFGGITRTGTEEDVRAGRTARRRRERRHRPGGARRAVLGRSPPADRAQLARSPRLRADVRRRGAQERLPRSTSAMARTSGPPSTRSTPRSSIGSPSNRRPPARAFTASPTRASRSVRSPRPSARGSAFRRRASPPTKLRSTSAAWRTSRRSATRRRARAPGRS